MRAGLDTGSPTGDLVDRPSFLDLLHSQHTFPGEYTLRVITVPATRAGVLSAVSTTLSGHGETLDVQETASSRGRLLSLRIRIHTESADDVVRAYDVLNEIRGVRAVL